MRAGGCPVRGLTACTAPETVHAGGRCDKGWACASTGSFVVVSLKGKLGQLAALWRGSATPLPLMLDAVRLCWWPYTARGGDGLSFQLRGGRGEWYTFYENVVCGEYFLPSVSLGPGDTVVDIGANLGMFALVAARRVGDAGRVLAFEPDPETFGRLQSHIVAHGLSHVEAFNRAVGGADGRLRLFRSPRNAWSTLYPEVARLDETASPSVEVEVVSVSKALAEAGDRVALLKVDCEGAEYAIFDAMAAEDAARIDQVVMEVHPVDGRSPAELFRRLESLGFDVTPGYPVLAVRRR